MTRTTVRLLLRALRDARPRLLAAVLSLTLLRSLVPAAVAEATAVLIGRVQHSALSGLAGAALVPLVVFALILGLGHVSEAALEPLMYLAEARIDGAHRARVTRLAATSPTIARLEAPEVRRLVRTAQADPGNWTERTPGAGAMALVSLASTFAGVAASCAVLAGFAWWLIPLLLVPALVQWLLYCRRLLRFVALWRTGIPEMMRAYRWEMTVISPGEGKDIRIYGFGEWLVDRIEQQIDAAFAPAWEHMKVRDEWRLMLVVGIPLTTAFGLVAAAASSGRSTVAVEAAVMSAGWSVFQALGWSDNLLSIASAGECLQAYTELCEVLAEDANDVDDTDSADSTDNTPGDHRPTPQPDSTSAAAAAAPPLVRFEGVCFGYPGTGRTVIDRLDLEIRPGELLAVVGLNGAGKSTLIKLLSALYRPTAGRITADGLDIARLGPEAWRDRISVVFQDFVKYHLSVEDNVALGRGGAAPDRAAIEAAAADAGLGEVLARLPLGWKTPLARSRTGGADLSGGQWQQVVLARALYALRTGARLLVLDEPTAHLDVRTEFDVFRRLAERRGESSVVLISHRLSTVRRADRIVLLDGGRITESGTHDELVAAGGEYAEMFAIQAARFTSGYEDHIEEGELL
jgi:ABC-type multidrug transport system fused ATPase/permease subunit